MIPAAIFTAARVPLVTMLMMVVLTAVAAEFIGTVVLPFALATGNRNQTRQRDGYRLSAMLNAPCGQLLYRARRGHSPWKLYVRFH